MTESLHAVESQEPTAELRSPSNDDGELGVVYELVDLWGCPLIAEDWPLIRNHVTDLPKVWSGNFSEIYPVPMGTGPARFLFTDYPMRRGLGTSALAHVREHMPKEWWGRNLVFPNTQYQESGLPITRQQRFVLSLQKFGDHGSLSKLHERDLVKANTYALVLV